MILSEKRSMGHVFRELSSLRFLLPLKDFLQARIERN